MRFVAHSIDQIPCKWFHSERFPLRRNNLNRSQQNKFNPNLNQRANHSHKLRPPAQPQPTPATDDN